MTIRSCLSVAAALIVFLLAGTEVMAGGGGPGPIDTGFSYQGQLTMSNSPVDGICDFQFSLWDSSGTGSPPVGGVRLGVVESQNAVAVSKGLFTVVLNGDSQFTDRAFEAARWLQIAVRFPAGSGTFTTLSPRQPIWAAPYAMGLRPGTIVRGSAYQNLKVQSDAPTGGTPAALTGEIMTALDGVGVYGSNNSNAAGSAGAGVWGRTYNLEGAGVKGTGHNGSDGVLGEALGTGNGVRAISSGANIYQAALFAENKNTKASEPAGIAVFGVNHSGDATIVAWNTSGADSFRAINAANTAVIFRVRGDGVVVGRAFQASGADLAERFTVPSGRATEPGTLMVIDEEHPGKLKPSVSDYDSKVAGVISGAGGIHPGMTLNEGETSDGEVVVALVGRVYVKAEAHSAPIRPGDLLTSSLTPGHAMKAIDRDRRQGAIIGKAMTGLESGTGLVLVLVSLQ